MIETYFAVRTWLTVAGIALFGIIGIIALVKNGKNGQNTGNTKKRMMFWYDVLKKHHSCNDCGSMKDCKYSPGIGNPVRYNCPHFRLRK